LLEYSMNWSDSGKPGIDFNMEGLH